MDPRIRTSILELQSDESQVLLSTFCKTILTQPTSNVTGMIHLLPVSGYTFSGAQPPLVPVASLISTLILLEAAWSLTHRP